MTIGLPHVETVHVACIGLLILTAMIVVQSGLKTL